MLFHFSDKTIILMKSYDPSFGYQSQGKNSLLECVISKKCSIYHVVTQSEFRPDMDHAFMVIGHYTKYE